MNQPILSVLMSVYNETESQIFESVSSILVQTFSEFELIIINDNPQRDLLLYFKSFHDERIRFYANTRNIGLAMSMNRAASLAQTNMFARMDADDIAEPNRFEQEIRAIEENNADFVFSSFRRIDENSKLLDTVISDCYYTQKEWSKAILLKPYEIHHPTVMFKRDIFERVNGYRDFPCSQDVDLWLRMAECGCRFYKINKPLLRYRINKNGVTSRKWFLQKLTVNFIFELGCLRLLRGNDNYSIENYNAYLLRYGIENNKSEIALRKSIHSLHLSKVSASKKKYFQTVYYRLIAQLQSKITRRHMLFYAIKYILLYIKGY